MGEDQQQHIEFARDTASSFNHLFGPVLHAPSPLICKYTTNPRAVTNFGNQTISAPAKRVMSLKDPRSKMSKSHADPRSRISLIDSPEEIQKKINLALTDSNSGISYDPVGRPGVSNLIQLLCHFDHGAKSCDDIITEHGDLSIRAFKELLGNRISDKIGPVREKYLELVSSKTAHIDSVAEQGAENAKANADLTLHMVKKAMGLC